MKSFTQPEDFYVSLIKMNRRTPDEVIAHLKNEIKSLSKRLIDSIDKDNSFVHTDILYLFTEMDKYSKHLVAVLQYKTPANLAINESKNEIPLVHTVETEM